MNQLDLFLGAAVLLFTLSGLFGGAVKRVIHIAALVIAFKESWTISSWVAETLEHIRGEALGGLSFLVPLISFVLIYVAIRLVGSWFATLSKGSFLWAIDKTLGAVLGLLVGVYLMGYACLTYEKIFPTPEYNPEVQVAPSDRQASVLYPRLMGYVDDISQAKDLLFGAVHQQIEKLPNAPEAE